MKSNNFRIVLLGFIITLSIATQYSFAQGLSGSYTIPGSPFATIKQAVDSLNLVGVGTGGVTFNVTAGHTESVTAPITITVTGTGGNTITFQKSGGGTNPLVTRTDAGSLSTTAPGAQGDAVIRLEGTDYITFDRIDLTATDEGIEYGYFTNKPDGTNGCQFVSILNASVTLNKGARDEVIGICISNGPTSVSSATGVVVSTSSGMNDNILIAGCTIDNAATSIYQRGATAMYDGVITIGQSGGGNVCTNLGSPSTSYGFYSIYANDIQVAYNSFSGAGTSTLYGTLVSSSTDANVDIFENTITLTNTSTSSSTYGISNSSGSTGVGNTVNIYNNTIENFNVTSTGSVYGVYNSASAETVNMYGNIVRNNTKTIAGTGTLSTYWVYNSSTAANGFANVYDNQIYGNTNSGGTGDVYCLYSSEVATTTKMVYGNSVYDNTGPDNIYGIYSTDAAVGHIYQNNIYDLTSSTTTTTTSMVAGLQISTGTDIYVYNNFISDLKAPASASTDAIRGIYLSSASATGTRNLYYNTVYLDASSSGANFGSSGLYHTYSATATYSTLDIRNNVIVNNSTPTGTGLTVAFRRSSATSLANYNTISNNNNFYAGTPSASNLLFSDGTNNLQLISEVQAHLTPGESASVSGNPPFINVGSAPYDLHISTTTPTQLESGGTPITTPIAVNDDYDGDTRNATTPDIGADEFVGIGADLTPPNITYTLLPNVNYTSTSVSLTATITDASGIAGGSNSPRFYLKKINDLSYVFDNAPTISGDDYTFTINYSAIGGIAQGDTIVYYVAAQDVNGNVITNPFGGSGSNPPGTTPPSTPNFYLITDLPLSGTYTVGLAEFIQKTGKQVYFETRTRTVTKDINGPDAMQDINAVKEDQTESKIELLNPDRSPQFVTVTETYKELMENGKPFDRRFYQESTDGIYPTLTEAINDLNLRGVSGPVTFSLVDSYYPNETFSTAFLGWG
ncbi:MAG: hypothetical protein IPM14_14670 [bacterium]|nr:hypothetical protein [bacterium]